KLRELFISNLANINIKTKNVDPDLLLSFLDEILNPDQKATHQSEIKWDSLNPLNIQASDSESVFEVEKNQIHLKDNVAVRSFSVKNYPEIWAGWEMKNLLGAEFRDSLRLSCPFLTNLIIEIPNGNKSQNRAVVKEEILQQRAKSKM